MPWLWCINIIFGSPGRIPPRIICCWYCGCMPYCCIPARARGSKGGRGQPARKFWAHPQSACDAGAVSAASELRRRAPGWPMPPGRWPCGGGGWLPLGGCWRGGPPPPRPDGGWPPDPRPPPLPRPEGGALFCIEVVVEELRSLPRSSVVARRRARGRARDDGGRPGGGAAAAAAVSRHRDGAGSGVSVGPRWAAPLAAFVGTRWLETSRSGTCASQIALRRKARAPRRPGVRNGGGGGGGDLPARPSRREGRRLRARRAAWRRQGRVGPSASVSALASSAPRGAARALGRLALHKLRAKSVSTSARVL